MLHLDLDPFKIVNDTCGRVSGDELPRPPSAVLRDRGRNRVHVYRADDQELALRHCEMNWIGRIRTALDEQRFVLGAPRIVPLAAAGVGAAIAVDPTHTNSRNRRA